MILLLGSQAKSLDKLFDSSYRTDNRIDAEFAKGFEWVISYGYRHVLKKDVLDLFPNRAINLHISYLPWNRGADPNYWSFVDDTPKGVSIHFLDEGIDTGDIIAQREVIPSEGDTLRTLYEKLHSEMFGLFNEVWPSIQGGRVSGRRQEGGSTHKSTDKAGFCDWDTPIELLMPGTATSIFSRQY